MRQCLANLWMVSILGGCSLIYNPSNIEKPPPDASTIDMFVADADPTRLMIDDVGPHLISEGQGDGGSRPVVLALVGHNFVDGATVELIAANGEAIRVMVDNAHAQLAPGHDVLAVPVTLMVDPARDTGTVALTVKVTQNGIVKMLEGKLQLENLPQLDNTTTITSSSMIAPKYSKIDHAGAIVLAPAVGKPAALFRSMSSVVLGNITADAMTDVAGPGGEPGAASGADGTGPGAGKKAAGGAGASGAGFSVAGSPGTGGLGANVAGGALAGDPSISSYTMNHGSSGGGGTGGAKGGAGGGTVEVTAGGTLTVGTISVRGGAGAPAPTLNAAGGGGSGGAVVLRAGVSITLGGPINADGGAGGSGGGGNGAPGRIRIDAPSIAGDMTGMGARHVGPAFDPATPIATKNFMQPIATIGSPSDTFHVFVINAAGSTTSSTTTTFGTQMTNTNPTLSAGYNHVCITPNAMASVVEATTCIDLAYLP